MTRFGLQDEPHSLMGEWQRRSLAVDLSECGLLDERLGGGSSGGVSRMSLMGPCMSEVLEMLRPSLLSEEVLRGGVTGLDPCLDIPLGVLALARRSMGLGGT
mmetsp:Transcript_5279/g.14631  ORF Transcript_5279/g.14631 Transcript_5279/m.14631 type:complete len:102 (-) Transcript_5279:1574-1879(-)